MKRMKRLASLMLAILMMVVVTLPVSAEELISQGAGGTITIENPSTAEGAEYHAYLMFELESYSKDNGTYSYTITPEWKDFLAEGAAGAEYFEIDNEKYVILKKDENNTPITLTDTQKKNLATAALAYAKTNRIVAKETLAVNDGSCVAENLPLGYYLVDSTVGALCSLNTTDPVAVVKEKNTVPTVEKQVQENSTEEWGEKNNANIGDVVNFKTVIQAKPGAHKYILHDRMGEGLTLITESENAIKVSDGKGELSVNEDYTIEYDNESETTAEVKCDFEIHFTEKYLTEITEAMLKDTADNDSWEITVTYAALLNENAKVGVQSNRNATFLQYGDNSETELDYTDTYAFLFDLVKTDAGDQVLSGAEFELYRINDEEKEEKVTLKDVGNATYRVATPEEIEKGQEAVIKAGDVEVKGLDAGKYILRETKAPVGYNRLTEGIEFVIEKDNLVATVENGKYIEGGIRVINETGTLLPETGGMGTTIFYVAGGALVLAAVVVLITRKRMNAE